MPTLEMCTPDVSAAMFCPARWSHWTEPDVALPTPMMVDKNSIKPFATGPVFVQPPSPPFWRQ